MPSAPSPTRCGAGGRASPIPTGPSAPSSSWAPPGSERQSWHGLSPSSSSMTSRRWSVSLFGCGAMPDSASLAEAFLEQSPACSWIVSAESEFQRVYGDSLPVFGKTAAELVGRRVEQALDKEAAPVWSERMARALRGETLLLRERRGNAAWHIRLFPIHREGGPRLVGGMAAEVTLWNKAEQELRNTVLSARGAQEFERSMFSKFLHDSVGQNLTGLGLQLDLARMDVEAISPEACRRIAEIQKILEPIMEQVREYTYELNPSAVERAGLRSALDRLAN